MAEKLHPEFIRQMCRDNLGTFCVAVNPKYEIPYHVRLMLNAAEKVDTGEWDRVQVSMPPRHSKSETWSIHFPAWFLGRHPDAKIMVITHGQMLANRMGGKIRDLIDSPTFQEIFPDCKLNPGAKAKNHFETTLGGEFLATTVNGTVTGFGADLCLDGSTMIETDHGPLSIEAIVNLPTPPRVLSWCHESNQLVWGEINASRKIYRREILEVTTTQGRHLRCTPEHRIWSAGEYKPAASLRRGDSIQIAQVHMPPMRSEDQSHAMLPVLQSGSQGPDASVMLPLPDRLSQAEIRIRESCKTRPPASLLQPTMLKRSFSSGQLRKVSDMRSANGSQNQALLRCLSSTESATEKETGRYILSSMWTGLCNKLQAATALLQRLRRSSSLAAHDWFGQLAFFRGRQLQRLVQANAANYPGAGRQYMRGLLSPAGGQCPAVERADHTEDEPGDSSHQREPDRQPPAESHYSLPDLSRYSSSFDCDTVSMVTGISDREVTVYDIEVKGTNNFFADQILVHNCLIDDPIKDAQDAYSLVIRQQVIEFYRSVAYPRLMPGGRMVIILTRWHSGDLAGWLLDPQEQEKVEDWKLLVLPAIAECDEGWRKEGEALWPEKFSLSDLERIKRVKGDWDWAAQYQQRPSAIEGREIKRAWWKYYEWNPHMAADRSITRVLTQPYHIYQSWDTASKTDQQHDYSVCTTWLESGGNQYLLHMWRKKVIAPDLFQAAKDLALYWQAEAILVEDSAPAHAFVQMLQSQTKLPIIPITPKGDKAARARGVSPIIQAGRVFLPACQTSWLKDFLDEVSGFPVAAHDDALDSCTQYLSWQCIERDREESWAHTETADSPIDLFDI